ncbi:hypothetical protein PV328_007828 [Microctonus aethiopoides]|uniref:Uncharacterized protein n=1 Tax=Microctonus aethiopoides TaxID=144406 RepID=A0AA39C9I4_9HYME|nr:hypothetical protein PV328_007828 [Microctonus aethiopoides]
MRLFRCSNHVQKSHFRLIGGQSEIYVITYTVFSKNCDYKKVGLFGSIVCINFQEEFCSTIESSTTDEDTLGYCLIKFNHEKSWSMRTVEITLKKDAKYSSS